MPDKEMEEEEVKLLEEDKDNREGKCGEKETMPSRGTNELEKEIGTTQKKKKIKEKRKYLKGLRKKGKIE